MPKKPIKLLGLAAALTALSGATALWAPPADAKASNPGKSDDATGPRERVQPNVFLSAGKDLLGMIVTKGTDGIVTADHYSHSSHASHSSHSSHYSGR